MDVPSPKPLRGWRQSLVVGWSIAAIAFAASAGAQPIRGEAYTHSQRLVRLPDGRRLNLYCTGEGSPTVVLEGGWTTETLYWRKVQPALSEISRVCSYDRAGYGYSDPGPMPRSASNEEQDLDAMLRATPVKGRIILVAHSIGSLDARLFADRHREKLAGLVLLDPFAPVEQPSELSNMQEMLPALEGCSKAVERGDRVDPADSICLSAPARDLPETVNDARLKYQRSAAYQHAAVSEIASAPLSAAEIAKSDRSWGKLPLVIITAGESAVDPRVSATENAHRRAERWSAHEKIASLSRWHVHILLVGASHFIPIEHPEAVVEAVGEIRGMNR